MKYKTIGAIVLLTCLLCSVEAQAQDTYSSFIVNEIGYQILPNRDREVAVVNRAQYPTEVGAASREAVPRKAIYAYPYRTLNYQGDVKIPTTVTYDGVTYTVKKIEEKAFSNYAGLTSIELPTKLDSIGRGAFYNCGIESISIPGNTRYIENGAFFWCNNLKNVVFEDGTEELALSGVYYGSLNGIFFQCPINTLYLGRNIVLQSVVRQHFSQLNTVIISDAVTNICDKLFYGLTTIKKVTFGKNVERIGKEAFGHCSLEETSADLRNVRVVGEQAFQGTDLYSVEFSNQLDSIGKLAFNGNNLTSLTIPSSTRYIGASAFSFGNIKSLTIEEGAEPLHLSCARTNKGGVFSDNPIDTLYLRRNIELVEGTSSFVFGDVKNVVFGETITALYEQEFWGSLNIETVFAPWRTPFEINSNVFHGNTYNRATLVIPKGTTNKYKNTEAWSRFLNMEEEKGEPVEQTLELTTLPAMTYGDAPYTLPGTTAEELALTWISSNTAVAAINGNQLTIKKVGSAIITATQDGDDDYLPFTREFTLTIAKAQLKITANNQTKQEGEDNPALTVSYDGFKYSDKVSSLTKQPTVSTTATKNSPAGTYPITPSGAQSDNYTISYVNGTLTITEKPQGVTDISLLDNAIYIEPFSARIGGDVNIEIRLKNSQTASAYKFDLVLPEGVAIAKDNNGRYIDALSDRHSDHSRTLNYKEVDKMYSFATLSGNSEALTGNDGAIRLITLHVADDVAEGTYFISIKNASYSQPNGTEIILPNTITSITAESYVLGDVNDNGHVDIGDAVSIVNYLVGKPSTTFIEKAADTNKNGHVDIGDAVTIVNYLVGKTTSLSRSTMTAMDGKDPQ